MLLCPDAAAGARRPPRRLPVTTIPKTVPALLAWARKSKIEVVDLKFVDLFGR